MNTIERLNYYDYIGKISITLSHNETYLKFETTHLGHLRR